MAHIFWIIAPHCPGHAAYGVIFYVCLPDHTQVNTERELLVQKSINKYLMSSYYVQGSVLGEHPRSPSYTRPPLLLPVPSHLPSLLCSGFLPSQGNTGPVWASIHCTMHPPKRRDSELLPTRSIGEFETVSETVNRLFEVEL